MPKHNHFNNFLKQ